MKHIIAFVFLFASFVNAQQSNPWRVDKNHTSVGFTVTHMVISEVAGWFRDFDIAVNATKDDFSDATFEATLKVDSIDTGNARRDGHLKADDFFNAARFPVVTFKSTAVEKAGENHYAIIGDLTIRDVTKSVRWDAELKGIVKGARTTTAAWKATLSINRFDYNLKWDRTMDSGGLVAGEAVRVTVVCELQR